MGITQSNNSYSRQLASIKKRRLKQCLRFFHHSSTRMETTLSKQWIKAPCLMKLKILLISIPKAQSMPWNKRKCDCKKSFPRPKMISTRLIGKWWKTQSLMEANSALNQTRSLSARSLETKVSYDRCNRQSLKKISLPFKNQLSRLTIWSISQ